MIKKSWTGLRQRREDVELDYIERFLNKHKFYSEWSWCVPQQTILIHINFKDMPVIISYFDVIYDNDFNVNSSLFLKFLKEKKGDQDFKGFLKEKML